jgi:hypothetical protein
MMMAGQKYTSRKFSVKRAKLSTAMCSMKVTEEDVILSIFLLKEMSVRRYCYSFI